MLPRLSSYEQMLQTLSSLISNTVEDQNRSDMVPTLNHQSILYFIPNKDCSFSLSSDSIICSSCEV